MENKRKNKGTLYISSMSHIGCREEQQDSFGIFRNKEDAECVNKGVLAIVADGMGGLANGSEVSGIVVESARHYFMNTVFREEKAASLTEMVYHINEDVRGYLKQSTNGELSGSTLVAVYICNRKLYFVSVGDSRIYLYRNGGLIQLNREHIQLRELYRMRQEGLSYEEIMADRQKSALTSYIGVPYLEDVDYNLEPISLEVGDKVLLMSDGVFGTLSEYEMRQICEKSKVIAKSLEKNVLLKEKATQDNMTAVVLEYM